MKTASPASDGTYIPGYVGPKIAMLLAGVALFLLGVVQLERPLRLLVFGEHATAVATSVIKTKPGLPDLVLHDDSQIQTHLEPHDRSYVFWNEFSFDTKDSHAVNVRIPVGSQLKPLYPLLDLDGLPTTQWVCYDPRKPETVVFPSVASTWFASGMMVFIGLLTSIIASVLLYWANKPIALPHIPPSGKVDSTPPQ